LAAKNIDSAIIFIQQAILSIDSAIVLASDSELMALNYSNIAQKYATRSYKLLKASKQEINLTTKQDLAKQAMFMSANAVTEAYHASFYFKNCKQQKEEKKDTLINTVPKQVTKLDIDQTLFALLDEHLHEKTEEDKKEVSKLTAELKTIKDPVKTEKIKEEIKKLEKEEAQLEQKDKNTKEKLTTINTQIDERNKNNTALTQPQETVFSKSMKRPADEWDKDIQIDAELPMGLIYQIQIGYYKKLIVSEIFRGLTPIMGKTMPNGGVSYSIGMFEKVADAQQAKAYVKSLGLTDAFVIASYNRKKITLSEAAKLEKK
jgi:cell division protein FtsB